MTRHLDMNMDLECLNISMAFTFVMKYGEMYLGTRADRHRKDKR